MAKYLGEYIINIEDTEFKDYSSSDWAMYFIEHYGQIDGSHHKQWVLDQVARVLKGSEIILKIAKWDDGSQEYRVSLGKESKDYTDWVEYMKFFEDGEYQYDYDTGIAP